MQCCYSNNDVLCNTCNFNEDRTCSARGNNYNTVQIDRVLCVARFGEEKSSSGNMAYYTEGKEKWKKRKQALSKVEKMVLANKRLRLEASPSLSTAATPSSSSSSIYMEGKSAENEVENAVKVYKSHRRVFFQAN